MMGAFHDHNNCKLGFVKRDFKDPLHEHVSYKQLI